MTKEEIEELAQILDTEEKSEESAKSGMLSDIISLLWSKRKYYYISIPIAFVVAVALSLSMPKYYTVNVKLAPEMSNVAGATGGLNSIMRSFGMSRSASTGEADAILPNLYPDLMNSQMFLVSLFDIPVVSKDGQINTTYYEYLSKHQKTAWWTKAKGFVMSLIPQFDSDEPVAPATSTQASNNTNKGDTQNALALNKSQTAVMRAIAGNVVCDVDKKTFVINIAVKAQDPVICATVADSTCRRLQEFITEYRTKKARIEYAHMLEQYKTARAEYEEAKEKVAAYNDANWDLVEEDFVLEKQALQNEMQLRFSALSNINTQLLASRSKLDEARPVFTILDGASVPLKPTGPSKKKFIIGVVFFVCLLQTGLILARNRNNSNTSEKKDAEQS